MLAKAVCLWYTVIKISLTKGWNLTSGLLVLYGDLFMKGMMFFWKKQTLFPE